MIYIVYKDAVYRHEFIGVFDNLILAKVEAIYALKMEGDGHHDIKITPAKLNKTYASLGEWKYGLNDIEEEKVVFNVKKIARNWHGKSKDNFRYYEITNDGKKEFSLKNTPNWLLLEGFDPNIPTYILADKYDDLDLNDIATAIRRTFE